MAKYIRIKRFLGDLFLKEKGAEEIDQIFQKLFSEIFGTVCASIGNFSKNDFEFVKSVIIDRIDNLKDNVINFRTI